MLIHVESCFSYNLDIFPRRSTPETCGSDRVPRPFRKTIPGRGVRRWGAQIRKKSIKRDREKLVFVGDQVSENGAYDLFSRWE